MRIQMISLLLVGFVFTGLVAAQPPANPTSQQPASKPAQKPAASSPESLEALMAAALKSNADIQVAEAKLREAEANLNKARVTVMQQVAAAHSALQSAR